MGDMEFFLPPQLSYNTYIILIIAIYATIKEYIKFVKEKASVVNKV